jgi:putative AlgH/UPF0301 family transcriptional regulator
LGTIGLIVNRPSGLNHPMPHGPGDGTDARPVYFGGPVNSAVSMLIRNDQTGWWFALPTMSTSAAIAAFSTGCWPRRNRTMPCTLPGHAGWPPEQLALEIEREVVRR